MDIESTEYIPAQKIWENWRAPVPKLTFIASGDDVAFVLRDSLSDTVVGVRAFVHAR